MQKHILLLFDKVPVERGHANPDALIRLMQNTSSEVNYSYAFFSDLIYRIDGGNTTIVDTVSGKDLATYDFVYLRRCASVPVHAMSCAIYLHKKAVPFIDSEAIGVGSINKLTQHWRLWSVDLPIPKTIFLSRDRCKEWLSNNLENEFSLPFIMKSTNATRGNDNHLVHSLENALDILTANPESDYLLQTFIPNDGDYRAFVIGDQLSLLIHRRTNDSSHTNNTSQGGQATLVDNNTLSKEIQDACIKAAQSFHRDIAGVDVVIDKTNPDLFYFFEVNRSPQIEDSSYSTEKAEHIAAYIEQILASNR